MVLKTLQKSELQFGLRIPGPADGLMTILFAEMSTLVFGGMSLGGIKSKSSEDLLQSTYSAFVVRARRVWRQVAGTAEDCFFLYTFESELIERCLLVCSGILKS